MSDPQPELVPLAAYLAAREQVAKLEAELAEVRIAVGLTVRLDHHRTLTCDYCHGSWVSPSGHGRICPSCRGGEQHRADKAAYHRAYRQRRKSNGK